MKFNAPALLLSGACFTVLLSGCKTQNSSKYVDPTGPQIKISIDTLSFQDLDHLSGNLVSSLLASGVLERSPELPTVMAIGRFRNKTDRSLDVDYLTGSLRSGLLASGKVAFSSKESLDGQPKETDPKITPSTSVPQNAQRPKTRLPYYILSGEIRSENPGQSGNVRQRSYSVRLELITTIDGLTVWEGNSRITKQEQRASAGW